MKGVIIIREKERKLGTLILRLSSNGWIWKCSRERSPPFVFWGVGEGGWESLEKNRWGWKEVRENKPFGADAVKEGRERVVLKCVTWENEHGSLRIKRLLRRNMFWKLYTKKVQGGEFPTISIWISLLPSSWVSFRVERHTESACGRCG